ncbi:MAG: tRNA pseudouridine(38-40) synthase TruA [Planctomycetota bacterium]|jgi:tRNA pseudouridine38-40 synthase
MTTFRGVVEYDGTDFHGWQVQPEARTVQRVMEDALAEVLGERVPILAAGRTDAGVHALGQGISFRAETTIPGHGLAAAMNTRMPRDASVLSLEKTSEAFHATHDAMGKLYRYMILRSRVPRPLTERTAWRVAAALDVDDLAAAAAALTGTRDFASFRTHPGARIATETTVRTLHRLEVTEVDDLLSLEFEGDGFLHHMVRNVVGTLVQVGRGTLPVDAMAEILERRDRSAAGPTAPSRGLTLVRVDYPVAGEEVAHRRKNGIAGARAHTISDPS